MELGASGVNTPGTLRGTVRHLLHTKSTSAPYDDFNIDSLLIRGMHRLQDIIIGFVDHWEFEGQYATADTVKDQDEYSFPTDILQVYRIETRYSSGASDWVNVNIIDERIYQREAIGNILDSSIRTRAGQSFPQAYLSDKSFFLDPTPDTAITTGFRVWFTQEITLPTGYDLPSTAATETDYEPNFVKGSHDWLCYYSARQFALSDTDKTFKNAMKDEMKEIEVTILKPYYSSRVRDKQTRIIPHSLRGLARNYK